jgi:HSP20 family protein
MSNEAQVARNQVNNATERARDTRATWVAPAVDVYENADEFLVIADVPGTSDAGLGIELDRGELRIEAKRGDSGGYRRVFTVPDGIDADGVRAELTDGVVRVHLPKGKDVKPRRVQVTRG